MPRMRTKNEAAQMLREQDPGTSISRNAIRTMVLSGRIPHVSVGSKRLIDFDRMLDILQNPPAQISEQSELGTIRRVV